MALRGLAMLGGLVILAVGLGLVGSSAFADGASEGREGLERMEAAEFEEASEAFRRGLVESAEQTGSVREALLADLGLAEFAQGNFMEAAEAFGEALQIADTDSRRAMFAYNAGTALANAEELEQAVALLRRALILSPAFTEARVNYEIVKRRLDGGQSAEGTPPEPSAFAEELKARADSLIALRLYSEAARTMNDGLAQDSTVAAYSDFMQRLDEVLEIESMATADSPQ